MPKTLNPIVAQYRKWLTFNTGLSKNTVTQYTYCASRIWRNLGIEIQSGRLQNDALLRVINAASNPSQMGTAWEHFRAFWFAFAQQPLPSITPVTVDESNVPVAAIQILAKHLTADTLATARNCDMSEKPDKYVVNLAARPGVIAKMFFLPKTIENVRALRQIQTWANNAHSDAPLLPLKPQNSLPMPLRRIYEYMQCQLQPGQPKITVPAISEVDTLNAIECIVDNGISKEWLTQLVDLLRERWPAHANTYLRDEPAQEVTKTPEAVLAQPTLVEPSSALVEAKNKNNPFLTNPKLARALKRLQETPG